jgi:hypothetical protein
MHINLRAAPKHSEIDPELLLIHLQTHITFTLTHPSSPYNKVANSRKQPNKAHPPSFLPSLLAYLLTSKQLWLCLIPTHVQSLHKGLSLASGNLS